MENIEIFHHEKLNITSYHREDGKGGLLGEVVNEPYRKARDQEAIPEHLTDLSFYDADGNLLIPTKLFGP